VRRSFATSGVAAAIALAIVGEPARAGGKDVAWETLEPGVEHARARTHEASDLAAAGALFELYRFDLARFRPEVIVSPARPFARRRAADVLRDTSDAVAVVNGGFFDDRGAPLGLRIARGKTIVPLRPHVDWGVLLVTGGRARIVHSSDFVAAPDIEAAIQVGPRILIDGVVPSLKAQAARRTAVALTKDGTSLTLVVAPEAVDAAALGARLAKLGFYWALLLDGGPSTQLALGFDGQRSVAGAYGVPDLLALVRRRRAAPHD
jgi:uncharacterized protein YigE (DUF2233 family)